MSSPAGELLKSAYEVAREERLRRNRAQLEFLGLGDESDASRPVSPRLKKSRKLVKTEPSRRSKRTQGLTPEGDVVERVHADEEDDEDDSWMLAKIERLKALHLERRTAYKNPTATYEHTWMRVRTMSDNALENRVRAIERALGQHCVVKMQMFAEVLLLAGKKELARCASESLNRLLDIVKEGKAHQATE